MIPLLLSGLLILWLSLRFVKTRLMPEPRVKDQAEVKVHEAEEDVQSRPLTAAPTPLDSAQSSGLMETQAEATSTGRAETPPSPSVAMAEGERRCIGVTEPVQTAPEVAGTPPAPPVRGPGRGGMTRPRLVSGPEARERLKFILGASEDYSSDEEPAVLEQPGGQAVGGASSSNTETSAASVPSPNTHSGFSTSSSNCSLR